MTLQALSAMKKILLSFIVAISLAVAAEPTFDGDEYAMELDRWYAGASAVMALPQGGAHMRRVGGASARAGYYLDEFLSAEFEAAWCEDVAAVSGGFLWPSI